MTRRMKVLISTVFSFVLAIAIYAMVLIISNSNQHTFDLTKNQRHTLSQQSRELAGRLDTPVKAYVFQRPGKTRDEAEALFRRYADASDGAFQFELLDLERSPTIAEALDVRYEGQAVLAFTSDELSKDDVSARRERVTAFEENAITNALLKLTRSNEQKLYFLTGHGERALDSQDPGNLNQWKTALATEGYLSSELKLAAEKKIPDDTAAIVIAGPTAPLLEGEKTLLEDYLQEGGHLFLLAEMETPKEYVDWVASYGVELKDEIIIDEASAMVGAEPVYAVGMAYSAQSPITRDSKTHTIFRLARTVAAGEVEGYQAEQLVQTAPTAFPIPLEKVLGQVELAFQPEQEAAESLPLAVAVTWELDQEGSEGEEETPKKSGRLLVFGDADAFSDRMFQLLGNKDLGLNAINWLCESEDQITIRAEDSKAKPLVLENSQMAWMRLVSWVLIPMLVATIGFVTQSSRRRT